MTLTELNDLVESLAMQRSVKDHLAEELESKRTAFEDTLTHEVTALTALKVDIERTQLQILEALKESGNKSWKTEHATISRKSSTTYKVADKEAVFTYLRANDLLDEYTTLELIPASKTLFESTEVPGVEKNEKEYISVLVK